MAVICTIDRARRVVIVRAWGTLSNDDVREQAQRLMADPGFDPSFSQLTDLSEVKTLTVDAITLAEEAALPLFDVEARRAIVAPSDATYGIARMFASFATGRSPRRGWSSGSGRRGAQEQ
jgi:hypothetical protein